jgi:uncharacterized membrane protein YjgN (DUF898 family)
LDFTTGDGRAARPAFHGAASAMFPVVLRGLLFTVLTLGVYRFWYVTDVRRFLWNGTEVDGDGLEYVGRGVELFVGFLIAIAVLLPLYGALSLIGLVSGPYGAAALQFGSTFGLLFLAQFALFRARRYRLTRTVWRGVRFQQSGSAIAYAAKSFGWALVSIVTLGLAYPWMRASLERYKMTNTWYGDQRGDFSATGWQLFRKGIALWLIAMVALVATGALTALIASGLDPDAASAADPAKLGLAALPVSLIVALSVVAPIYLAIEYRWWANGCSVGPASANCDLGAFAFFKVYLGYAGVALLFALLVGLAGGAAFYGLDAGGVFAPGAPDAAKVAAAVAAALAYFAVALVFAALWQLFVIRPTWRKSFESVVIFGLPALIAAQSTEPVANAFGEGVADAIDFGGF